MKQTRQADARINMSDSQDNTRYRILAVMLSSVPAGSSFGRGSGSLNSVLCSTLKESHYPIISSNFSFDSRYGLSKELSDLLSGQWGYGVSIGLRNVGMDFIYQVTERTHEIAKEIENLQLMNNDDINYLKSLGEKLIPSSR